MVTTVNPTMIHQHLSYWNLGPNVKTVFLEGNGPLVIEKNKESRNLK